MTMRKILFVIKGTKKVKFPFVCQMFSFFLKIDQLVFGLFHSGARRRPQIFSLSLSLSLSLAQPHLLTTLSPRRLTTPSSLSLSCCFLTLNPPRLSLTVSLSRSVSVGGDWLFGARHVVVVLLIGRWFQRQQKQQQKQQQQQPRQSNTHSSLNRLFAPFSFLKVFRSEKKKLRRQRRRRRRRKKIKVSNRSC